MRNVSNHDSVAFQPLGSLGTRGDVKTLTATVAGVFELNHRDQLSVGYTAPLSGGSDEPYDGELRIMFTR